MTATELFTELQAAGVSLWFEGDVLRYRAPHGVITPERKAVLAAQKPKLLARLHHEVRWRVEAMRDQVPERGQIPFLVARSPVPGSPVQSQPPQAKADGPSRCLSCGKVVCLRGARCELCIAAVNQVLAEARAAACGRSP
jgi:hypothetical protein